MSTYEQCRIIYLMSSRMTQKAPDMVGKIDFTNYACVFPALNSHGNTELMIRRLKAEPDKPA